MSTIPLSEDFKIIPGVVSPAGDAVDANGLMLTDNELIPVGKVQSFYQDSDISALTGSESKEFLAGQQYFNGYDNSSVIPGELMMYRVVTAPVAGYLLSGSMKGVTLASLKSTPASTIKLVVDGVVVTSTSIDLSAATSFTDIADKVETGIGDTKVSVEWLSIANRFIIRSATTGATSQVSYAYADSGAIATALKLTAATAAIVSPGSAPVSMTDMMDNITNSNQNWIPFESLVDLDEDQNTELCAWTNAQNSRFVFVYHESSAEATIPNNPDCFFQKVVVTNGYEGIFPIYGSYLYGTMPLAYSGSIDFARTNGRVSFKFRAFSGLAPNVTDLATARALKSNGYNFYGAYSLNKTMKQYASDGAVSGKFLWLDSFIDQVWINANLVSAYAELFTDNQSYAFNANGYGAVQAATIDPAELAVTFGAIQKGVTLDVSQIRRVNNTVGKDISSILYSQGWYLNIPTQTGASRIDRNLQGVTFFWVDGQLIQSITMSSTAIL